MGPGGRPPATIAAVSAAAGQLIVGRVAEQQTLRGILDRAVQGHPSVALVTGEPGIGKSRLVDELAGVARRQGVRVLRGEAMDGDATPFGLWVGVVHDLGVRPPDLEPSERRWALLDALADGLTDAGTGLRGPNAVAALTVLEDVHWADESSLWVLERLPRRLGAGAVAIVATARPVGPGTADLRALRRLAVLLELTGLDVEEVGELVRSLGPGTDEVTAAALRDRTGGNPLFLRELLALKGADGRLPGAVRDVLAQSIGRLPERARGTLAALSLAGPGTPIPVVAGAAGVSPDEALEDLDQAHRLDVLRRRPGGALEFRHALLAETAADLLAPGARRALHQRLAWAWGEQGPGADARARRAGHLLAVLPGVGAEEVARDVLAAVQALRAAGDEPQAAELARLGVTALGDEPTVAVAVRARLGVELGAALHAVGDDAGSVPAFERAAALAREVDDPVLAGTAEVGAARYVSPFIPQFDRIRRLAEIESALPSVDSPLRVELLGRMCVMGVATPEGIPEAHARGDTAVAMARRLGDPSLVANALADRYLVPAGLTGYDAKAESADELVAMGERSHRNDVLLHGYEWRMAARLDRLDLHGAEDTLERFEALAELMPSPRWRYAAMVRRVTVEALRGRYASALAQVASAAAVGATCVDPTEVQGIELGGRMEIFLLWNVPDDRMAGLYAELVERSRGIPAPFIQVQMAFAGWALGDTEAGYRCLERYGHDPATLLLTMEGPVVVSLLGVLAAAVGDKEFLPQLRQVLQPFELRLATGNSLYATVPAATTLGRLALADGDLGAALAHHDTAIRLVRAMRSPPLLALALAHRSEAQGAAGDHAGAEASLAEARTVAARIGLVLPVAEKAAPSRAPAAGEASLVRAGGQWTVRTPHGSATVPDSLGMAQLARLLALPGRELAAVDLAGMADRGEAAGPVAHDMGPALDARAKREYRRRIAELQTDIDEADAHHDLERAARARVELDALIGELRRAVGLGGRDRPVGAGAERARVNVTRSIRRAIAGISDVLPGLGAHLTNSVRTGHQCSYVPEPAAALQWSVMR